MKIKSTNTCAVHLKLSDYHVAAIARFVITISVLFVVVFCFQLSVFAKTKIRVGFLPNLTHAQALIGKNIGLFSNAFGPDIEIDWHVFNNSSNMIEAMFVGNLDFAYIGPNPAINAFVRSKGSVLRIIAGSSANGVALLVRKDSGIQSIKDLAGKKIAFPNIGGTQDISLKQFLKAHQYKTKTQGGDIELYSLPSRDHVNMFLNRSIDASWTPEPWISILGKQTGAKILFEEKDIWPDQQFATTLLTVSTNFLESKPDLVKVFVQTHVEITEELKKNQELALSAIEKEMTLYLRKPMPEDILHKAFQRVLFTYDPLNSTIWQMAKGAFALGYYGDMKQSPDITNLFSLSILEAILKEKHLHGISH